MHAPRGCLQIHLASRRYASVRFDPAKAASAPCVKYAADGITILKMQRGRWETVSAGSDVRCPVRGVPNSVLPQLGVSCFPTTDPISNICNRDEPQTVRTAVAQDLTALEGAGSPPSRTILQQAQTALEAEATDLNNAGMGSLSTDVSNEAQAIGTQLQGTPPVDVVVDLKLAASQRNGVAGQDAYPGCVVPTLVQGAASSTSQTPNSSTASYRGPSCTFPGPSGAPETKPSCINKEGCRAIRVKSGTVLCGAALSITDAAISADQQRDDVNPTIRGFSCNVYPYEVDCSNSTATFSANFGDTGQQSP